MIFRDVAHFVSLISFFTQCDIVTVNAPLHEGTRGLVNKELLKHFKKGAWLVNTARGAICVKEDVAEALKTGQLNGMSALKIFDRTVSDLLF